MIYDAFISYRHAPLDMEFAKKVHTGLETFRVPAAVRKKTGKKRIQRVFRDQEELPIGSDLNENIAEALRESEFLIVICSPETPGSYWVCKEIETFIALHGRQNVLAVLADGEPAQSFPPQLLTDGDGNPVEPLAADVRGATPSERNRKFKTELLRLAAPILGCTYDDLRQRHRERILKRNLLIAGTVAGVIAAAGAAFGVYNAGVARRMKSLADEKALLADEKAVLADEKTKLADDMTLLADEKTRLADEILVEFREKQKNQSRFFAEEAMRQLESGNREDAVLIAAAGLPSGDNDRPYVAEAEYALASALHAYDYGEELTHDRILLHDQQVRDMAADRGGRYLFSIDYGKTVYVWDARTGERLLKLPFDTKAGLGNAVLSAFADEKGAVVAYKECLVRYDYAGAETARSTATGTIRECYFAEESGVALCVYADRICAVSLADLSLRAEIPYAAAGGSVTECSLSPDGKWFAVGHYISDGEPAKVTAVNLSDFTSTTIALSENYILNLAVSGSENLVVASTNSDFFYNGLKRLSLEVFHMADGEKQYSVDVPADGWNTYSLHLLLGVHSHEGKSTIVLGGEGHVYSYNEQTGELKAHFTLPAEAATLNLNENSTTAFIGCRNGDIVAINTEEGYLYSGSTVNTNVAIEGLAVLNGAVALRSPRGEGIFLMKYHSASDLAELPGLAKDSVGHAVAPSAEYYVLESRYKNGEYSFYDADGTYLYTVNANYASAETGFYGDDFVIAITKEIRIVNPREGSEKTILLEDLGIDWLITGACFSEDGRYVGIYGTFSGVAVIDLAEERCLYCEKIKGFSGTIALSGDASCLLISQADAPLQSVELATGTVTTVENPALQASAVSENLSYLACDTGGKHAAMVCADGSVHVVLLPSGETVFSVPLQTHKICFLQFTKDGKHILMEGDDSRVRVFRVSDGVCLSFFDVPNRVHYTVESDGLLALCDDYTVSLLETENFGRLAYVPSAVTYLSTSRKFVILDGRAVLTTQYKDYQALLLEAQRQFPGAELSEEKKVLYNIE